MLTHGISIHKGKLKELLCFGLDHDGIHTNTYNNLKNMSVQMAQNSLLLLKHRSNKEPSLAEMSWVLALMVLIYLI